MRAVRVEVVASRPPGAGSGHLGGGGHLVHADQCFALFFDGGVHEIIIQMLGRTESFRLDGAPNDAWISIYFMHDGVNQLHYGWSWSVTSASSASSGFGSGSPFVVPGQVPPVGPQGVMIGNRIGAPLGYLNGNIQSVKIWRQDPKQMIKNFVARPFTPAEAECWGHFGTKLKQSLARDPECAATVINLIGQIQTDFLSKLANSSPETIEKFWRLCGDYQKLWAAGKVGSVEMQNLVVGLRQFLKSNNLFNADDPDLIGAFQDPCFGNFINAVGGLECDPGVQKLLKALLHH